MAKKSKKPVDEENPNANSSSIFSTLFGGLSEQKNVPTSLFSEDNPFRRKPQQNQTPVEDPGSDLVSDEKKKKRKKTRGGKSPNSDSEAIEVNGKKLKRDEQKKPNLGVESVELAESGKNGELGVEDEKKKKKKKRKRDELELEYEARRYGVATEEKGEGRNKQENNVVGEKRKKMDNPEETMVPKEGFDDESKLARTIFVGNLPLKIKKKTLIKEFGKFGKVDSVRIRSIPLLDSKVPRKGAILRKQINENADSVHAYIVFETEESVQASLAHNMAVVGGNHIRVDRACPPRKKLKGDSAPLYDNQRTVFMGNLPFDVKDEEIYQLLSGIKSLEGSIEAVRVIRDSGTSLGKGIAYVLFKTREAANMLVRKHNLKLRDRELRLQHAKLNATPSKRKTSLTPDVNESPGKKFGKDSGTPSSDKKVKAKANLSYQGIRATKSGKKIHSSTTGAAKSKSGSSSGQTPERKKKRPAVAARKERTQQGASASKQVVGKRKLSNRTPESGQRKKARKIK